MIQIFSPRFHFGVDLGLPFASEALASCARRAFARVTMSAFREDVAVPTAVSATKVPSASAAATVLTFVIVARVCLPDKSSRADDVGSGFREPRHPGLEAAC